VQYKSYNNIEIIITSANIAAGCIGVKNKYINGHYNIKNYLQIGFTVTMQVTSVIQYVCRVDRLL